MPIRRILPTERHLYLAHMLRLDTEARRLRFAGFANDRRVTSHVEGIDLNKAVILGLFVDGEIRGVAEVFPEDNGKKAEVAFSLERELRGQGLGKILFDRALDAASLLSIEEVHVTALWENTAMRSLVKSHNPFRSTCIEGYLEADLTVPDEVSVEGMELQLAS